MSGSKRPATKPRTESIAKSAAPPSHKDKNTFKSTEFVKDSDDEEDGVGSTPVGKNVAKPIKPKASLPHKEKKESSKQAQALPKPTTGRKKAPLPSDSSKRGSVEEPSNEQASLPGKPLSNGSGKVQSKALAKGPDTVTRPSLKRKSPSPSNDGTASIVSDDDESNSPTSAKRRRESPVPTGVAEKSTRSAKPSSHRTSSASGPDDDEVSQNGSEEDAGIGSTSESGSESESRKGSGEDAAIATSKKPNAHGKQTSKPQFIAYAPPLGFEPAGISSHASSSQREIFSLSNLQGKQIWHITVPRSVPVTSITEVAKQSVQDGSAVLSYKGADYGLISEAESQGGNLAVLLPTDDDSSYRSIGIEITKTLHLQQLVRLPSISHDVGAEDAGTQVGGTVSVRKPYEKPAPEQPKGLKMRYKPIGVSDSESDSNHRPRKTQKAPEFRVPSAPSSSQSPEKRKHGDIEDRDADEHSSPRKLAKIGAAAKPVPILSGSSSVKQTPQEPKPAEDKGSKGKKGEDASSTKSKRGKELRRIERNPTESKSVESSRIEGSSVKLKPTQPREDGYSSSTIVNKSSSPTKENPTKSKKHLNENIGSPGIDSKLASIPNGIVGKSSPSNTGEPAEPPIESQTTKSKKPRRKHKSVPTHDETTQDDNPEATKEAPQPKESVVQKKPPKPTHDQKPAPTETDLPRPSKASENSSSQPIPIGNERLDTPGKSKHEGETPEERKKRRDEKKRRKEAKANAKL